MAVRVDESKCKGCGLCIPVCPRGAITVDAVAQINAETCTDCGSCVAECPHGALFMEGIKTAKRDFLSLPSSRISLPVKGTLSDLPRFPCGGFGIRQAKRGSPLEWIFALWRRSGGQGRGRGRGCGRRRGRGSERRP